MKLSARLLIVLMLFSLSNCKVDADSNFIEIEQILGNPAAFANKGILIQGIVNQVNSEKQLFSVISQKEFKECGIADCNINEQLPVRYVGELPEVGKLIEITGTVKQIEKGFIYEAESIKHIESL
jgi:hypothetical protein